MFPSAGNIFGWIVGGCLMVLASQAMAGNTQTKNSSNGNALNNWAAFRDFDPLAVAAGTHADTSDDLVIAGFFNGGSHFGDTVITGASDHTICQMRVDCSFTLNGNAFVEGGQLSGSTQPAAVDQTGNSGYYFLGYVEDGDDGAGNPLFTQGLKNDYLSFKVDAGTDCGLVTALAGQARCNEIDYGFTQSLALIGDTQTLSGVAAGGAGTGGTQVFDLFFSVNALVDANGSMLGQAKGTFTQSNLGGAGVCSGTFTYDSVAGAVVTGTSGSYTLDSGRTSSDCP